MKYKIIIMIFTGVVLGVLIDVWIFFPCEILANTIDAGFLRMVLLIPPMFAGAIGYAIGDYLTTD